MILDLLLNSTTTSAADLILTAVFILITGIVAISAHEYAHLRAAKISEKANPLKQLIKPRNLLSVLFLAVFFVSWTKSPESDTTLSRGRRLYVSLSGILTNLLLALISLVLYDVIYVINVNLVTDSEVLSTVLVWISSFFTASALVNTAYALFNILPVPGLDGGLALSALMPEKAATAFLSFSKYSFPVILFLALVISRSGAAQTTVNAVLSTVEAPIIALINLIAPLGA